MFTCADCKIIACRKGELEEAPKNCPMKKAADVYTKIKEEMEKPANKEFLAQSAIVEKEGYCEWPRLRETMEFCKAMKYKKIGIAFCVGLKKEAQTLSKILRENGFTVTSVICKNGSIPKEEIGLTEADKINSGNFEAICNPIGQAMLLNHEKTDFNIVVGLCVGHDSLFFKYAQAPTTVLIAKDRVLAHNPAGAIYCAEGYLSKKIKME